MDVSRLVIGVALAVVTYLLILAWNEDYDSAAARETAREEIAATSELPAPPPEETPRVPEPPVSSGREEVPATATEEDPRPQAETARPAAARYVESKTAPSSSSAQARSSIAANAVDAAASIGEPIALVLELIAELASAFAP